MKFLILFLSLISLAAQAETIKFNMKNDCANTIEATIPNYIKQLHLTKICTQNSAKLNGQVKCSRDLYGEILENRVINTQCQTKIFHKYGQKFNRILCQSTTVATCRV